MKNEIIIEDYMYRFEKGEYCDFIDATTKDMWCLYQGNDFIDSFDTESELLNWIRE